MQSENNQHTNFVLVSEKFHPDTESTTGQLITDLAIGLQERGLDITVYTRDSADLGNGSSKVTPESQDVEVKRMNVPEFGGSTLLSRGLNWLIFVISVSLVLLCDNTKKQRELIFVSHPPILPPFLWAVCRLRHWEYTYIVYDFYPPAAVELGYIVERGIIHKVWARINSRLLLRAKHIVALGPEMRKRIIKSCNGQLDSNKIKIIHNWENGEFVKPRSKEDNWFSEKHDLVDSFSLIYSGNIGEFHDLETVIRTAACLENSDIRFLIIGEGDDKESIVSLAKDLEVSEETLTFLPYQPWEDVPYSLTSGDATIVAVDDSFRGLCVSSKLYSSLATGQPVLVISSHDDDEAQIIEAFDAGIQVSPGNVSEVLEAIEKWSKNTELVERQGSNAREAFETHFTPDHSIERYYTLLTGGDLDKAPSLDVSSR